VSKEQVEEIKRLKKAQKELADSIVLFCEEAKNLKSLLRRALDELARLEEICIDACEDEWYDVPTPDPSLGEDIRKALSGN
jgi:hypothetical protein